jgi:polysaccharide export outer membrane protein
MTRQKNLYALMAGMTARIRMEATSLVSAGKVSLRYFAAIMLVCAGTLSACGQETPVPAAAYSVKPLGASAGGTTPSDETSTAANYLLRSGDLIRITVFQEDDLTTEVRVPQSGSVMFPLLGSVPVLGKSVADAQEQIRSLLAQKYIKDPHVNLAVLDYSKLWVTVLGEVQKPGNVEIPTQGGLDLLGAIALSGGFGDNADEGHVNVRRRVDAQDTILSVNVTDLSRDPNAKPFMVQPGDAITVPYAKKWVTVLGEVKTPGKVNLPTEGDLDVLGALALAGGYTPDADPEHVDILRRSNDGRDTILTVNAKQLAQDPSMKAFEIQPGDTITVKFAAKQMVTILGEVKSPGKVKIPPEGGLDLLGAIALAGGFTPDADIAHITVRRAAEGKDLILTVNAKKLTRDSNVEAFMVQPDDSISVPERIF